MTPDELLRHTLVIMVGMVLLMALLGQLWDSLTRWRYRHYRREVLRRMGVSRGKRGAR